MISEKGGEGEFQDDEKTCKRKEKKKRQECEKKERKKKAERRGSMMRKLPPKNERVGEILVILPVLGAGPRQGVVLVFFLPPLQAGITSISIAIICHAILLLLYYCCYSCLPGSS